MHCTELKAFQVSPCDLQNILCSIAWSQYMLRDGENWPTSGSLNYNTTLQLNLLCKKRGWISLCPCMALYQNTVFQTYTLPHWGNISPWPLSQGPSWSPLLPSFCCSVPSAFLPIFQFGPLHTSPFLQNPVQQGQTAGLITSKGPPTQQEKYFLGGKSPVEKEGPSRDRKIHSKGLREDPKGLLNLLSRLFQTHVSTKADTKGLTSKRHSKWGNKNQEAFSKTQEEVD